MARWVDEFQSCFEFRGSRKNGAGLPIDFGRGVARAVYLLVSQDGSAWCSGAILYTVLIIKEGRSTLSVGKSDANYLAPG